MLFKTKEEGKNYATGYLQHPLFNTSRLVGWMKDGLLLTKWKYINLAKKAKQQGITMEELLTNEGFMSLSQIRKMTSDYPTEWINADSGLLLMRDSYVKAYKQAKESNEDIGNYLEALGYMKLLESKVQSKNESVESGNESTNKVRSL